MHKFIFALALFAAMTASLNAAAQTQDLPDPLEMAAKMADQLEKDLDLDVAQVFKIDTLFQHVYTDYYAELEKLVKSGVSSSSSQYLRVSDKWGAYIDARIEEIVDEEQWAKYLKSDAGKGKKKRDKRIAEDKY